MALVIDTNILLYAANSAASQNDRCRSFLEESVASGDICFLPENVVYEFLRVATHPRVFPNPLEASDALKFVSAMLAVANFRTLSAGDNHWQVFRALVMELGEPSGNFFFDVHTVALMREHGIRRIATADADFFKFRGLEIINPVR
ncbi:MAG TPA: TA system VapC family ribonuclease toxin [Chthoniobacterales bacterium]